MMIMAVPTQILFSLNNLFEGFQASEVYNYERHILDHYTYMRRGTVEPDPSWKQPIPYAFVVNPQSKKVYAYQRSSDKNAAHESRLHGKWSWGVGGHIEQADALGKNPIHVCLEREVLAEEVDISGKILDIRLLGYINDHSDKVSEVHFGILYLIETDAETVSPKDAEMKQGKFMTLSELEEICSSPDCVVEAWSKVALESLKKYFATLS